MFCCDKSITITHIEYNGERDAEIYTEQTLAGVSWYVKSWTAADANGLKAARLYQCRIPADAAPAGLQCIPGDRIRCGDVTATVLDVHDNRGRPAPHWYVEAS